MYPHYFLYHFCFQGLSLVQAAIRAGVQHFVYSGLASCMEVTGQKCPESEGKSKVENFMFASELPSTSLRQPISMENILIDFIPLLQEDGTFVWSESVVDVRIWFEWPIIKKWVITHFW